jgi:hypothetical protein
MTIKVRTDDGQTYEGDTLDEVVRHMSSDLDVGGPRTIYAEGGGYEARVSLEEGVVEYAKDGGKLYWVNE